jgi:hypothetical protein
MRTYRFIRLTVILAALAMIPWLPMLLANAADQPSGAGMPSQETTQAFTEGVATAPGTWVDELANSLKNYKATHPISNFDAYTEKLSTVRTALDSGNKEKVRAEMGMVLQRLRTRAYGINDVAADLLFNSSLMVAPIQEYRISIPPPVEFGMPRVGQ